MSNVSNVPGPTFDKIAEVVRSYIELTGHGSPDEVAELFADNAVVENPTGGDIYRDMEEIRDAYHSMMDDHETGNDLVSLNVAGGEAAVHMQVALDGQRIDVIDVMTFDDEAKITSLRAYWGPTNVVAV